MQKRAFYIEPAYIVAVSSVIGIYTLKFSALMMLALAASVVLGVLAAIKWKKTDEISILLLINFFYWIVSGVALGGLGVADFLSPEFIEGDGRVFLYYLPLLVLSFMPMTPRGLHGVIRFLHVLALLTIGLYFVWLVSGSELLSTGGKGDYGAFFTSHNGAGSFFGLLTVFLLVYGSISKDRATILIGVLMLLPTFASGSRQTLVGMLMVVLWFILSKGGIRALVSGGVLMLIAILSMPYVATHTWERTVRIMDKETISTVFHVIEHIDWEPGEKMGVKGEDFNVLSRMLFWSHGIGSFKGSPFVGIGFARYNDQHKEFNTDRCCFRVVSYAEKNNSSVHAHNSYIHFLAELGMIGTALIVGFWFLVYRKLGQTARVFCGVPALSGYLSAAQAGVVFLSVVSMFGHGMAAPSIGILLCILVGTGLAAARFSRLILLRGDHSRDPRRS